MNATTTSTANDTVNTVLKETCEGRTSGLRSSSLTPPPYQRFTMKRASSAWLCHGERGGPGSASGSEPDPVRSVVEVQRELVRVRAEADGVDLVLALVVEPGLDELRREDVALEQEGVILLERVQRRVEGAGRLRHVLRLLGRQVVDVLVERLAGVDLVLDAVEAGHQHGREGQVRVGRRVGAAELE